MTKPFDADLYNLNDPAKHVVVDHLLAQKWRVGINADRYGIDLIGVAPDGQAYLIEVEVKHAWQGDTFPYDTLHIPARKIKFAEAKNSIHVILNSDHSSMLAVWGKVVQECPLKTVPNKYVPAGEQFYEVPVSRCEKREVVKR